MAAALDRRRRAVVAILATAAAAALIQARFAMTSGPRVQDGVSIDKGMILAILILLGTAMWHVGGMVRAADRRAEARRLTAPPVTARPDG
jgi:hypothetical protein